MTDTTTLRAEVERLAETLRRVEPDTPGVRTRWYRNPDGPDAADTLLALLARAEAADAQVAAAVAAERADFLRLLDLHRWLRTPAPSNPEAYDAWVEDNTSAGEDAAKLEAAIRARGPSSALADAQKAAYRQGWNDREADFLAGAERTGMIVVGPDALRQAEARGMREAAAWHKAEAVRLSCDGRVESRTADRHLDYAAAILAAADAKEKPDA